MGSGGRGQRWDLGGKRRKRTGREERAPPEWGARRDPRKSGAP